jgi:hypothetical protein
MTLKFLSFGRLSLVHLLRGYNKERGSDLPPETRTRTFH